MTSKILRGAAVLEEGFSVKVLPEGEALCVLGTSLTLVDVSQCEIRARIAAGWRLFWSMRELLLNRRSALKSRMKLLDSTVGSCVLWCTESWTPRAEEARLLRSARRSMLRRVVGVGKLPDEDYLEWIVRATRRAESFADTAGVRDWYKAHLSAKWSWAGHVARSAPSKWVARVSTWRNSEWQLLAEDAGGSRPLRPSRRRWMKWEDSIRRYCAMHGHRFWMVFAQGRDEWTSEKHGFVEWSEA